MLLRENDRVQELTSSDGDSEGWRDFKAKAHYH